MAPTNGESTVPSFQVSLREEGPVVCSFSSGVPVGIETGDKPKFKIRKRKENDAIHLVGKDETCIYSSLATSSRIKSQTAKLCIGVYDKEAKKLKLYPAAYQGHIFSLSQSVPSYESQGSNNDMTAAETRKALFEDFGSAKKRKVLRSQEANRVNVDSVIGAGSLMVGSFLDGEGMSESNRKAVEERRSLDGTEESPAMTSNDASVDQWRRSFLPRFDQEASEPYKVYEPKDLVGDEVWSYLSRVIDACMRKDDPVSALMRKGDEGDERKDEWHVSVKNIVEKIPMDSQHAGQRLKLALVLNHFVNLYVKFHRRRKIPAPTDSGRFFGAPIEIANRFLSEYATQVPQEDGELGYIMSKGNKDKCCLHILILHVMASSWPTMKTDSLKEVADDIQIDMRATSNLIRHAGFSTQRKNNKTIVLLKAPVTFPKVSRGGPAKR